MSFPPGRARPPGQARPPDGHGPPGRRAASRLPEHLGRVVVETPIGPILLAGDACAICYLCLPNTGLAALGPTPGRTSEPLRRGAAQLVEYFDGRRTRFELALAPAGTAFQLAAWRALLSIPYGQTINYGELARRSGRPGAARAVGQANGANPLAIVIPCHRVVAAGGRLGGYEGGRDVKRSLLALEGSALAIAP